MKILHYYQPLAEEPDDDWKLPQPSCKQKMVDNHIQVEKICTYFFRRIIMWKLKNIENLQRAAEFPQDLNACCYVDRSGLSGLAAPVYFMGLFV